MTRPAPWDKTCELCGEPPEKGSRNERLNGGAAWAHRECLLRSAMGGIGHLEDHAYWCGEMHDPDGGRTLRQSALEVDDWLRTR